MKANPNPPLQAILGSLVLVLVVSTSISAAAATHYVDANSPGPAPPYLSWATAATVIQDAVDVATGGDEIVVTNGTYSAGGRALYNAFTNRVAVTKPLLLRSVNGPAVTAIQGYQIPGVTNGPAAIRCVYLTNGAILSGFTLTNGATLSGILYSNDYNLQQIGGGVWCETGAVVTNCFILGNSAADSGGGAYGGTLYNCTIARNSAAVVGDDGVNYGPLGGGAYLCTLSNCTLFANIGAIGGGAAQSTLNNCTLSNNLARWGGATVACTLNNCLLLSNAAVNIGGWGAGGGGADYESTLRNCTIVGNSAPSRGGVYYSHVTNSIIYFNTADSGANFEPTDSFGSLSYCCTTPLPASGNGNISSDPLFLDLVGGNLRLQSNSPCVNAGNNAYAIGPTDLGANPRLFGGTVDIGAYEFQGSSIPVAPYIISQPASQITYVGATASFTVFAGGSSPLSYQWTFNGANLGGATNTSLTLTNIQLSQSGSYAVTITNVAGQVVSTNALLAVYSPATRYVAADNLNATAPYTNWNIAASNVQDAIDVASPGDEIIVTNGVYARGGRAIDGSMTNRAALYKPVFVHSVSGPQFTMLQGRQLPGTTNGDGAIRCAYLTGGAALAGFTLTNGATRAAGDGDTEQRGGGVFGDSVTAIVSNCIVVNNSAAGSGGGSAVGFSLYNCSFTGNSAPVGGGAVGGVLWNCTLTGNLASDTSGGAWDITLNNCSIISNVVSGSGGSGGGVGLGTLTNCVLLGNQAASGGGAVLSTLVNCTLIANSAGNGGGASGGTLLNCLLTSNSVTGSGGAVLSATLLNCTLTANSAGGDGGGVSGSSKVTNSIVYFNNAPFGPNYDPTNILSYCCTTPLPSGGTGNITSDPHFVNLATGDFHLQSSSPCINAGNNSLSHTALDLDGAPRIRDGRIDLGAYEFQSGASSIAPAIRIGLSGQNITLAWPLWASNFVLTEASTVTTPPAAWTNTPAVPILLNGQNTVTLQPTNGTLKFYRLLAH
jgi:hypothetical protein